jgi:hypothetical protein
MGAGFEIKLTIATQHDELDRATVSVDQKAQGQRGERGGDVRGVAGRGDLFRQSQAPGASAGHDELAVADRGQPIRAFEPPRLVAVEHRHLGLLGIRQGQQSGMGLDSEVRRLETDGVGLGRPGVAQDVLVGVTEAKADADG